MKKTSKYLGLFLFLFSTSLLAQSFNYKVTTKRILSEKGLDQYKAMKASDRKKNAENYQFPSPSIYTLHIGNDYATMFDLDDYILGAGSQALKVDNVIRLQGDSKLIIEKEIFDENLYSAIPLKEIKWTDTGKDSILLGYKVREAVGRHIPTGIDYKVWYTKDISKKLGVHNLNHPEGFILAFTSTKDNPDDITKQIVVETFPYKNVELSTEIVKRIEAKVKLAALSSLFLDRNLADIKKDTRTEISGATE